MIERAEALLDQLSGVSVLVAGDVMLDEYVIGAARRLSPEAPVPVVEVVERRIRLGGAGNVAANVASLGARARLCGVVGADPEGARAAEILGATAGLEARVFTCDDRPTTTKTRIIAQGQQIVRVDRELRHEIADATASDVADWAAAHLAGVSTCVLSDYGKGFLSRRLLGALLALCRDARIPVLVDPKGRDFTRYRGASVITPNLLEARQAAGDVGEGSLAAIALRLSADTEGADVLITRGAEGLSLYAGARPPLHIPARPTPVFDLTGAGDTLVAALAVALGAGADLPTAAAFANHAAGIAVGKQGAATVSLAELGGRVTAT